MDTSATPFDPESEIGFSIGGVGGTHFPADPGELIVDLCKRDGTSTIARPTCGRSS